MKKKKENIVLISIFLIVLLLCIGIYLHFTKEEPKEKNRESIRVDASLATQPLMDAFHEKITDFDLKKEYTNTHPGYIKLIDGDTDLIIVTEPSEEELAYAKEKNVELEVIPVVNEGFVFFTNKENPLSHLTLDQIRKIYTGEITNWKEVGGVDHEIIAYQRPTNSGSQTGMLSLVMKDLPIKKPLTEEFIDTMEGIINVVVDNYESGKNAIGYSYYYYAKTMYGSPSLKFFKVDGIEPTYETIQDGSYPLRTAYYIVIKKSEPEKGIVRKVVEFLLSENGQNIAKEAGYVPIKK